MAIKERNSTDESNGRIADGRGPEEDRDAACTAKGKFKAVTAGSSKLFFYEPCTVCFPDGDDIPEDKTVVFRPSGSTYSYHRPDGEDVDVDGTGERSESRDYHEVIGDEDFSFEDLGGHE